LLPSLSSLVEGGVFTETWADPKKFAKVCFTFAWSAPGCHFDTGDDPDRLTPGIA
jgi:hypothetical protein